MYKLQPAERDDGTLPYPYFIDEQGLVGRQDFWNGKPYKLIGFQPKPKTGVMKGTIDIKIFFEDPQKAVGMYPIFADTEDTYYTYRDKIESVTTK